MRSFLILPALLLSASLATAAERSVMLAVENMTCNACPITVRKAIERVPGVHEVKVDFEGNRAIVVFDDAQANVEDLTEAARLAGFPAALME